MKDRPEELCSWKNAEKSVKLYMNVWKRRKRIDRSHTKRGVSLHRGSVVDGQTGQVLALDARHREGEGGRGGFRPLLSPRQLLHAVRRQNGTLGRYALVLLRQEKRRSLFWR